MNLAIAPEVRRALDRAEPVVALETTLICHGLPSPGNRDFAHAIETAVRAEGATPATIAVMGGAIRVGLDAAEIDRLATAPGVRKASARDLPLAVADGALAATTVAGTIAVAGAVGIRVMATGGIGGVHRGGETSLDVSADLHEIARQPVAVVCSGIKIILDLPRTLQILETLGVPVVGWRTDLLPGFYTTATALSVPRVDELRTLGRLIAAQRAIGSRTGLVVAQPPPAALALALEPEAAERLVERALEEARRAGAAGAAETPAVLAAIARTTRGRSVALNEALVLENVRLAARLAADLAARDP